MTKPPDKPLRTATLTIPPEDVPHIDSLRGVGSRSALIYEAYRLGLDAMVAEAAKTAKPARSPALTRTLAKLAEKRARRTGAAT